MRAESLAKCVGLVAIALVLVSCATPTSYAPAGPAGGYSENQLGTDLWHVRFVGNEATSQETVQTYWLYRSASLALEKGFQGFEIVPPLELTKLDLDRCDAVPVDFTSDAIMNALANMPPPPVVEADIRLLKGPIAATPPKTFDAAALKASLEPIHTKLCNGNICPHNHAYLHGPSKV